jgi:hypothetical protein
LSGLALFTVDTQFALVGGGIIEIGRTDYYDQIYGTGLAIDGDLVYATGADLSVVDIQDPASPVIVARMPTSCYGSLALARGHAYIAQYPDGGFDLCVANVSDPTRPVEVSRPRMPCPVRRLAVSPAGDVLYLACSTGELLIMDLEDPALPVLANTLYVGKRDSTITVQGDLLLFADLETGLFTFSLAEPLAPVLVGHEPLASEWEVTVAGANAYVGGVRDQGEVIGAAGVQVVDIDDPRHPRLTGTSPTQYGIDALAGNEEYVFAADSK